MENGSLEIASSEVKILVDDGGWPEKIYQNVDDESHQLVEEFMLLTNQTVARLARKKDCLSFTEPTLTRILKASMN